MIELQPICRMRSDRSVPVTIRRALLPDAVAAGRIIYLASRRFHESRGFPPDFASVEMATGLARTLISDRNTFAVVAERRGVVVGSNFLSAGDAIRGVGPITVDPDHQCGGVGRRLMEAVLERGADAPGIRLVQDAFDTRSMALYATLGFDAREPLALLQGYPRPEATPGIELRPMRDTDLAAADALCRQVHGYPRSAELRAAHAAGSARVVLRDGRLTGYMAAPHSWQFNHAVAETDDDLKALIAGAAGPDRPVSLLFPIRQADLFRWCLKAGLRIQKPMTLMSRGRYRMPEGAYLPSVLC